MKISQKCSIPFFTFKIAPLIFSRGKYEPTADLMPFFKFNKSLFVTKRLFVTFWKIRQDPANPVESGHFFRMAIRFRFRFRFRPNHSNPVPVPVPARIPNPVAHWSDVYLTGAVFTYHFEFALNPVTNNSPIRFTSHGQDNNVS